MNHETHIQTLRNTWIQLTKNFAAQVLKAQEWDYDTMKNDIVHLAEFAAIIDKIKPEV